MSSVFVHIAGQDVILRKRSHDVPASAKLQELVLKMREAMAVHDGIGIAALQIGEPLRIFLVARDLFPNEIQKKIPSDVFVNPKLVRKGFKRELNEEGCLSVPGVFGQVDRSLRITVEAYDANWKKFRVTGEGLLARVLQHELDHLEGILFVDRARPESLHEILPDGTVRRWKHPSP